MSVMTTCSGANYKHTQFEMIKKYDFKENLGQWENILLVLSFLLFPYQLFSCCVENNHKLWIRCPWISPIYGIFVACGEPNITPSTCNPLRFKNLNSIRVDLDCEGMLATIKLCSKTRKRWFDFIDLKNDSEQRLSINSAIKNTRV